MTEVAGKHFSLATVLSTNNIAAEVVRPVNPNDVLLSPAIQNLKKSLMEYVDQRLPRTPGNNPPAPQSTTPTTGQPGPAPNQP